MNALIKVKILSRVDLGIVSSSLVIDDPDNNGLDVGDRISYSTRAIEKVYRTGYGERRDVEESYITPQKVSFSASGDYAAGQDNSVVSSADHGSWREVTHDLWTYLIPNKAKINLQAPLTFSIKSKVYYDEVVCWDHDRKSRTDSYNQTSTMYFDVMPSDLDHFLTWSEIKLNDKDGDGLETWINWEVDEDNNQVGTDPLNWTFGRV
jgi:hypothetical protein